MAAEPARLPFLEWVVPREWRSWWHVACAAVLLVSVLVYVGSLSTQLVWDDHYLINGQGIGGGRSFLKCFTEPFLAHYCRPLISVGFFLQHRLYGNSPGGYHLTNLLLHALTTLAMIGLLKEAFSNRWVAPVGALFFAVQPCQVGAIAWMGGQTDGFSVLWTVLFAYALIAAARSVGERQLVLIGVSALCYTAAVFSKEQVMAALPLAPLAFVCFRPRRGVRMPGEGWWAALPFVAGTALFLAMGYFLGMPRNHGVVDGEGGLFALVGHTLCYYTLLMLAPSPRWMHTLGLGAMQSAGVWSALGGYLALAACAALFLWWLRRAPAAAWFVAEAVLLLLPVSNVVPLPYLQVAPYRAALSGIGVAALMGWGSVCLLEVLWRKRSPARRRIRPWLAGALAVYAAWCTGLTVWGGLQWQTERRIFGQILRYDPTSLAARYTLAAIYQVHGDYRSCIPQLRTLLAQIVGPRDWDTPEGVTAALKRNPRIMLRVRQNQGSQDDPHLFLGSLYMQLGFAEMRLSHPSEAARAFRAGLAVNPSDVDLKGGLGCALSELHQDKAALPLLVDTVAHAPDRLYVHCYIGRIYVRRDRYDLAVPEFYQWAESEPDEPEAMLSLADAQWRTGNLTAAKATYEETLRRFPGNAEATEVLGEVDRVLQRRSRWSG